jgi:hypothetical protein
MLDPLLRYAMAAAIAATAGRGLVRRGRHARALPAPVGLLDASLDHGDATFGRASRTEVLGSLAARLDANGRTAMPEETAYADAALRLARDAELLFSARRLRSARRRGAHAASDTLAADLAAPLAFIGAAERLLSARPLDEDWDSRAWAKNARSLAADILRVSPGASTHESTVLLVAAARRRRQEVAGDRDAAFLRAQGRRRGAARGLCVAAACRGGLAFKRFARSEGGVGVIATRVAETTKEIVARRLVDPAVDVLKDLLSPSKEHLMADPQSLRQAEATLETMLADWYGDRETTLSPEEVAARAKRGDLTSVGETLAAETRRPLSGLISGNIVRALLIQLQASARDAQVALSAVDDLLAAQTVTIRALALVPALLLLVLVSRGLKILFLALFSRSVKRTDEVQAEAAAALQEMRRVVLLARDDAEPLSDLLLGALAVEAYALASLLRVHRARFKPARLRRLDRSLRDLFAPLPARAVVAALAALERDHAFLGLATAREPPPPLTLVWKDSP